MEKWTINNRKGDFEGIMSSFGVSEVTARLLVNREITSHEEIEAFIRPSVAHFNDPGLLLNIREGAELAADAIRAGKHIRVVGDYDVDGIMATYILTDSLKRSGAFADSYIPHRIRDGYGINENIIEAAAADGVEMIITCDNGIAAVNAAEKAIEKGITLIVTDHHETPEELPKAAVIIDPKQPGDTYPCREICGAVVAAKLGAVLFDLMGTNGSFEDYLEFMAMATICDVVELKGENHCIAALGMQRLAVTSNSGLAALIRENQLVPDLINEYHVGFVLGPCFNATGRIDDASVALEMISTSDPVRAEQLAHECKLLNEERKLMSQKQEELAYKLLDETGCPDRVICLELEDCHESLLGIIAGRVKERYNRPAIIFTQSGEYVKGSARSIPAYNMYRELCGCSDLLVKFGGHPMAAGLSLKRENLEELRRRLNDNCGLTADDMCRKVLIDIEADFRVFDEATVEEINLLAPFGQGNPAPVFAERDLRVKSMRYMGRENSFLRFRFINSGGAEFNAVYFSEAAQLVDSLIQRYGRDQVDRAFDGRDNDLSLTVVYFPRINEFKDVRDIQMNIKSVR